MNILIVDDSKTMSLLIGSQVEEDGHTVFFSSSGEQALSHIDQYPIELVLMDVEMPGLDGFETTRMMREKLGSTWIPIIFLSAKNDEASFLKGIEAGGDDYLIKPISPAILNAKIKAISRINDMRNELSRLNQELETLTLHDSLTGCYNRRALKEHVSQQWGTLARENKGASVLMLDIDHFKAFNDFYGHPEGDRCLISVSQCLQESLHRPADILARYGGEEFIVFLPNTDYAGAIVVAEKILTNLLAANIRHDKSSTAKHVTTSIGIASTSSVKSRTLDQLIALADQQLYAAKVSGRNQWQGTQVESKFLTMVVDDDDITLEIVKDFLRDTCDVVTARSGQDCFDKIELTKPDLILMDINMPEMSGLDVCDRIRSQKDIQNIPIVLISSTRNKAQLDRGKTVGANGFIEKPLSKDNVVEQVKKFLLY